ncbi:hypothetical protein D3C71_1572090 [compost metagenome]
MWNEVQIATVIRVIQVDGWRNSLIAQGQDGVDGLYCTCSTQQVTGHGFGGTDHNTAGSITKYRLNGLSFCFIACRRRGAVGVNIANLARLETRVANRVNHRQCRTRAILRRRGHVIGIAAHAETNDFCIDFRATLFRVFVLFQYDHASTIAQNKTITVFVPRTACRLRILVAGRQRARCTETTHA